MRAGLPGEDAMEYTSGRPPAGRLWVLRSSGRGRPMAHSPALQSGASRGARGLAGREPEIAARGSRVVSRRLAVLEARQAPLRACVPFAAGSMFTRGLTGW